MFSTEKMTFIKFFRDDTMSRNSFIFVVFLLFALPSYSIVIPDTILVKCNTGAGIQVLSENEKGVILYINMARCYPKYFYDSILCPYIDSAKTNKKTKFYKTLKTDLYKTKSLKPLTFNAAIYPITKAFAKDMGRHGKTGHVNSKRETLADRHSGVAVCGENCSYGFDKPLDIVFQLILDEGIASFGHRKNILDPDYRTVAVSIHKHKKLDWNCVIDFAR